MLQLFALCFVSVWAGAGPDFSLLFSGGRLVRGALGGGASSVLLLFEPALPLGIEHSLGQPGTSLGQPGTSLGQPGTSLGQPGTSLGQPGTSLFYMCIFGEG
eukprot:scpid97128/ scgid23505/ 